MSINGIISETAIKLLAGYDAKSAAYPNTTRIIGIIDKIKTVTFPGYFNVLLKANPPDVQLQTLLTEIYGELSEEIETALSSQPDKKGLAAPASEISAGLLQELSDIQALLYKDAQAGFEGDPAARSVDEVILTYPGFFAIFVHRIAHFLFLQRVPLIPRIMSEHAHSITGIDIHPGATIGEYFFIDHGTGVVIGETTIIGNHVKLYQGVTLGALSTKSGQKLAGEKRHPTVEDDVIIYSGATILGGKTVIGRHSTIGGNVFITKSIPRDTTVAGI